MENESSDGLTFSYDQRIDELTTEFENFLYSGLTDSSNQCRQSLLGNLVEICLTLGSQKTNDLILSHTVTYLNHRDPHLRVAFFSHIVSLSTIIGPKALEHYVLPLLIQSLNDPDEYVIEKDICCLISLSELGLVRKQKILAILADVLPLVYHPNDWIRSST